MAEAIIFDLDGVIVDSEPLHLSATRLALALIGRSLTEEEYYRRFVAFTDRELFLALLGEGNPEIDRLVQEKQRIYRELCGEGVKAYPETVTFIRKARGAFPLALTTGSTREEAEGILRALGIRDAFQIVVSCEDYRRGKPDPEPYLFTARLLRLPPRLCLVIEDTIEGVRAAKAAGMFCLALTSTHPRKELVEADLVLDGLGGLDPRELLSRFPFPSSLPCQAKLPRPF